MMMDQKQEPINSEIPLLLFVGNLMVFIFFAFLHQFKLCFSKVFLVTENLELLSHVHLDLSLPAHPHPTHTQKNCPYAQSLHC